MILREREPERQALACSSARARPFPRTLNYLVAKFRGRPYTASSLKILRDERSPVARRRSPALTDAEAGIMTVLWQRREASVADVVAALRRERAVSYSTVQTILRILEE